MLLDEESRQYLTINTNRGLYRYTCLPFDVTSSHTTFQKTMVSVMSGLQGFGGILDDLIITGSNNERHLSNLESALERMRGTGIKLKKETVEYFAFVVDHDGIHRSPCKVQAIREVQVPDNPTELKSFLGMVNYYRRFIPDMATLAHPLNGFLAENIPWQWGKQYQEGFLKLKRILHSALLLVHYDPKKPV